MQNDEASERHYSERIFAGPNGEKVKETTLTKTYLGRAENLRLDPAAARVDRLARDHERQNPSRLSTDESGHRFAAHYGPAEGETAVEAAGDPRNLFPQSWVMNRGASSPWRRMEREVVEYRNAHPEESLTISITQRSLPERRGERPISQSVSIVDQHGTTPPELAHWTGQANDVDQGALVFMNPPWKEGAPHSPPKSPSLEGQDQTRRSLESLQTAEPGEAEEPGHRPAPALPAGPDDDRGESVSAGHSESLEEEHRRWQQGERHKGLMNVSESQAQAFGETFAEIQADFGQRDELPDAPPQGQQASGLVLAPLFVAYGMQRFRESGLGERFAEFRTHWQADRDAQQEVSADLSNQPASAASESARDVEATSREATAARNDLEHADVDEPSRDAPEQRSEPVETPAFERVPDPEPMPEPAAEPVPEPVPEPMPEPTPEPAAPEVVTAPTPEVGPSAGGGDDGMAM